MGREEERGREKGERNVLINCGRRLDWEDVAELEEEETVEVIVMMREGGKGKKKKGKPWNSDGEEKKWRGKHGVGRRIDRENGNGKERDGEGRTEGKCDGRRIK